MHGEHLLAQSGLTLVRIGTTYDMWLDGIHMSTSVASFEFEPTPLGTRLTHVEHGVFFDRFFADAPQREEGMRGLESLAEHLVQAPCDGGVAPRAVSRVTRPTEGSGPPI